MKEKMVSGYIARNHSGTVFTEKELQVIKNGDIASIVDTFFHMNSDYYSAQLKCVFESINRMLGSEIELKDMTYEKEYSGKFVGCQLMDGDIDVFLGVAGDNTALLKLASVFIDEELTEFDEDVYDALCELINCMNGAYATKLSNNDIEVALMPPVFYVDTHVEAERGMYCLTFSLNGENFNLLMSANDRVNLSA